MKLCLAPIFRPSFESPRNYARDGSRSRHNQAYWSGEAYSAYGLGASSYVSSLRVVRPRSLEAYCRWVERGGPRDGCEEDASAEPFGEHVRDEPPSDGCHEFFYWICSLAPFKPKLGSN